MNAKITVYVFKTLKVRPQCPTMPHILFSFLYLHFNSIFPCQSTWNDTVPLICLYAYKTFKRLYFPSMLAMSDIKPFCFVLFASEGSESI